VRFKKENPALPGWEKLHAEITLLGQGTYMGSLRAFGALLDFKLYLLTLFQSFVPFHFYRGIVRKDIIAAVRGCDETIPLACVKPLHSA
jgi:hypothetical protein